MSITIPAPTTGPSARAAAPGSAAGRALLRNEWRLFRREPVVFFWAICLPLIILVAVGSPAGSRTPDKDLGGLRVVDAYVPTLVVFALTMLAVNIMPSVLSSYRDKGILRRMSTTPVPPSRLLLAQVTIHAAVAVVAVVGVLAVGRIAFDVALPTPIPGFLLAIVLAGLALLALGTLVAAVVPGGRTANAVSAILFFPLMFLGGLWMPRDTMPHVLRTISDASPVGAAVHAIQEGNQGHWPPLLTIVVMAAWAIGCGLLAARLFRWE